LLSDWIGREEGSLSAAQRLAQNAAAGHAFQDQVLAALRWGGNGQAVAGVDRVGQLRNVIPDSLQRGHLEVKNVVRVVDARGQISAMADAARTARVEFNLVVSTRTESISSTVQREVLRTGGSIWQFDAASGVFTRLYGVGPAIP
jgi:hypothetical protein